MKKFILENGEVHIIFIGNSGFNYKAYLHNLLSTEDEYGYADGQPTEAAAKRILAAMAQPKKSSYGAQWARACIS